MSKITVKICQGTTCLVMGGSMQQELPDIISRKYGEKACVEKYTCLGLCRNNKFSKSPYVIINDEVISEATIEKVIGSIEKKIHE